MSVLWLLPFPARGEGSGEGAVQDRVGRCRTMNGQESGAYWLAEAARLRRSAQGQPHTRQGRVLRALGLKLARRAVHTARYMEGIAERTSGGVLMAWLYHGSWADNAGNEGEYVTDCVDCVPACAVDIQTDEGCEVVTVDGKGTGVYIGREGVYTNTLRGPSEAVVRACKEVV